MSICVQEIQQYSVPSELKPFVWCWPPSLCCCSMYLELRVHTVMLENSFQQKQGCTNHWWQVARGTIFCAAVPCNCCVLSMELPSCHITGVWNFKVPSRFWKLRASLNVIIIIFSLPCHVYSVQVIFNILTFWMVQDSCCHTHTHTHIYIYGIFRIR